MPSANPSMGNPGRIPEQQASPPDPCAPPFISDLPEMRTGCEVPKDMSVSHDTPTLTLKTNPHEIAAIPDLSAGGVSSQPDSVQNYPSPQQFQLQQLLQQQEAKWFQRYRGEMDSFAAYVLSETKKLEAKWYDRLEKKSEEIHKRSAENGRLIVGPHLNISAISNSFIGYAFVCNR